MSNPRQYLSAKDATISWQNGITPESMVDNALANFLADAEEHNELFISIQSANTPCVDREGHPYHQGSTIPSIIWIRKKSLGYAVTLYQRMDTSEDIYATDYPPGFQQAINNSLLSQDITYSRQPVSEENFAHLHNFVFNENDRGVEKSFLPGKTDLDNYVKANQVTHGGSIAGKLIAVWGITLFGSLCMGVFFPIGLIGVGILLAVAIYGTIKLTCDQRASTAQAREAQGQLDALQAEYDAAHDASPRSPRDIYVALDGGSSLRAGTTSSSAQSSDDNNPVNSNDEEVDDPSQSLLHNNNHNEGYSSPSPSGH